MKKQRIIRWLSALLCLCLLAGFAPAAMAYSNVSDWAKSEVAEMEALGLLPDCLLTPTFPPILRAARCAKWPSRSMRT